MKVAVRYYSRSGNTKAIAEAIASILHVSAISVDDPNSRFAQPVDVLFIGGALYAYGIDSHLKEYMKSLSSDNVKKAVIFSTSWVSKHAIDIMKKTLSQKGIPVVDDFFYVRTKVGNKLSPDQLKQAEEFALKHTK